jgi:hypothetical protein
MSAAAASLSYDAAPPFAAPLRFFLTAPLFGIVAGLLLIGAPELLASRWSPGALALTHLIAVGFMLSVMFGALFQILPVVAGAVLPRADEVSGIVHLGLTLGAACLSWGLGAGSPGFLVAAAIMLGATFAVFVGATAYGLWHAPIAQATPRDLRFALLGFAVAGTLGVLLATILARGVSLPLPAVLKLHVGWAWLGACGVLLAATSWVVVPMFQITPNYPARVTRHWAPLTCVTLSLWSLAVLADFARVEVVLAVCLATLAAVFAIVTLRLQARSRRAAPDSTTRAFRLGMGSLLAGFVCVLLAHLSEHAQLPLVAGILILHGGLTSAIVGMLYKIVPFLAWLHLSQDGLKAPNLKKLLPDAAVRKHLAAHAVAFAALLLAAVSGSAALARLAGVAVVIEFALLLAALLGVLATYRRVRALAERFSLS